jgi:hypothetical protein
VIHQGHQVSNDQGFRQILVAPSRQNALTVTHHRVGGDGDHGPGVVAGTQGFDHVQTADRSCQLNIEQHQADFLVSRQDFERALAFIFEDDFMLFSLDHAPN